MKTDFYFPEHPNNTMPIGAIELTEKEFMRGFFHYSLDAYKFNQVALQSSSVFPLFNAHLNDLVYKNCKGMGYAMVNDWRLEKMRFFRYGENERWINFENRFASQFSGDNS